MPRIDFHSAVKIEVAHKGFTGSTPRFHTLVLKIKSEDGSTSEVTLFTSNEPTALIEALKLGVGFATVYDATPAVVEVLTE